MLYEVITLNKDCAQKIMNERNGKSLLVIDLCNPRNVAQDVGEIEGLTLLDLDHMEEVVKSNFDKRKDELGVVITSYNIHYTKLYEEL